MTRNILERITLQPGQWHPIEGHQFQVAGQNAVRIAILEDAWSIEDQDFIRPDVDAPYFKTSGYDPTIKSVSRTISEWLSSSGQVAFTVFLMPDSDKPVEIVAVDCPLP